MNPSNPFGNLSEENHVQITKYLKFLRSKKESIIRTIGNEFQEAKNDRLSGETMFSFNEMEDYTDFLETATRNQVGADIGNIINMAALTVSLLLENAQEKGVDLILETSAIENQALLEAVDKMSLDAMPKLAKRGGGLGELRSFKDEAKARRDEITQIEIKNQRLQDEVDMLRNKLALQESELLLHQTMGKAESKLSELDNNKYQHELEQLEAELRDTKSETTKRVSDTAQFQQMMKLMKSQATTIKDLRRRLERYEPDNVKEDDDES